MDVYSSGNWLVKQGEEGEFVRRWRDFLEYARDNAQGFKSATLMRFADEPRRFVSVGVWESEKARADWKTLAEFSQKLGAARSLCDEFVGGDYNVEVVI
jgi:heme-degrading monooxygenase HmoA